MGLTQWGQLRFNPTVWGSVMAIHAWLCVAQLAAVAAAVVAAAAGNLTQVLLGLLAAVRFMQAARYT